MAAIQKKPLSKNFSHYVVIQGFHLGVFVYWSSVKRSIEGYTWPMYKGFYTLEEALEYARAHIGHDFYIEVCSISLVQANFIMKSQEYEEEKKRLLQKNAELTEELTRKINEVDDGEIKLEEKQEVEQLAMELSEKTLRIERYKKKGVLHVNRSFECLSVRLKMP